MYDSCAGIYQSGSQRTSDEPSMTAADGSKNNEDVEKKSRQKTVLSAELVGTHNLILVCGRIIPGNSTRLNAEKADYRKKRPWRPG